MDGEAASYADFLDLVRDEGLSAVEVQVAQAPSEANGRCAVVVATVRLGGGTFSAVGEASPQSAPPAWQPFLTTLAELRAKARALREATGIQRRIEEELAVPYAVGDAEAMEDDEEDVFEAAPARRSPVAPPTRGPSPTAPRPPAPFVGSGRAIRERAADADEDAEEDEADEQEAPPSPTTRHPAVPAPARPAAPVAQGEGIDRLMEEKLIKLAVSISSEEGHDESEEDARKRLDDYFLRAFKHPLGSATRTEGTLVVQRLATALQRLRHTADE